MKRKQIELKVKELYWLLGRKSQLSIEHKLLIYKTITKPIWTYGIEIWGCTSKSNQAVLQKAQSKTGNTPQPFTPPFTGHWAAKTTEKDPARGPAMR
jgi:hypothetical protein